MSSGVWLCVCERGLVGAQIYVFSQADHTQAAGMGSCRPHSWDQGALSWKSPQACAGFWLSPGAAEMPQVGPGGHKRLGQLRCGSRVWPWGLPRGPWGLGTGAGGCVLSHLVAGPGCLRWGWWSMWLEPLLKSQGPAAALVWQLSSNKLCLCLPQEGLYKE